MSRHNFLIHNINEKIARSLPYEGIVVDLGCGGSPYKQHILDSAEQYIGVDWENSQHDQSNVDIFANLCERLPFSSDYADTVTSFQVLEHLPEPDFFISECFRILKNRGSIFITVPFMWHIHEEPHDYFRYTKYGLEYLFRKNGFVDIEIRENMGFWQMWILKFNYHTMRFSFGFLKFLWIPIWWIGQTAAPIMDKYDRHPQETGSYTVLGKKP
ncbi:class I SAM-dependent methyltransferase [Acaryochloris sp. CCMEE 5410]|uniref:methyltransferase domain-containing protein n=1 Tax=Acaryochloris sp. CCMEE 5410 TaxID=310037 RepID=UPI00024838B9|nr:class I SAM-dependent methyltransferase [Acaryochloris sp. CCMEE 5410]KAI9132385.1 class I SAM-dependent methyltransferase [Acaryochloris sp. CCMEE 5410]